MFGVIVLSPMWHSSRSRICASNITVLWLMCAPWVREHHANSSVPATNSSTVTDLVATGNTLHIFELRTVLQREKLCPCSKRESHRHSPLITVIDKQ